MDNWIKYEKESLPPEGEEVVAYNHKWIDDFNPRGLRVGFLNGDGEFTSAFWWDYQDDYIALSKSRCESDPSFFERHLDNTEPEYWRKLPNFKLS